MHRDGFYPPRERVLDGEHVLPDVRRAPPRCAPRSAPRRHREVHLRDVRQWGRVVNTSVRSQILGLDSDHGLGSLNPGRGTNVREVPRCRTVLLNLISDVLGETLIP